MHLYRAVASVELGLTQAGRGYYENRAWWWAFEGNRQQALGSKGLLQVLEAHMTPSIQSTEALASEPPALSDSTSARGGGPLHEAMHTVRRDLIRGVLNM